MHQDGQKKIFHQWLQTHKGLLFKVIRAYGQTPDDRDDLFQEISIQLWNSIPNFKGDSAVATWIYRVALFTAMGWSRRQNKHQKNKQLFDETDHALTQKTGSEDARLEWLYTHIGGLNEVDRSLTLLLMDGYSYREMSSVLGISESNVGVKINRIKKYLTQKARENEQNGI